ncbi:MAG TPA: hypothetical protein PKE06_01465 [Flavilitoribacter sp.]|nr:hypothetical protein [Flavilitoribacter sp.]
MVKKLLLLVIGLTIVAGLNAQEGNWKKLRKAGDQSMSEGKYYEAAQAYEKAWQKKQSKNELIYQAAEAYYLVKDYRKAAEAYQHVKAGKDQDPLMPLRYGRSLKQDAQYDRAIEVFQGLSDAYSGPDKAILQEILDTEIKGARLAAQLTPLADRGIEFSYPGKGVNSDANEFAPFPITADLLYFSSTMGGPARIYSSQRQGNTWTKASPPGNFPVIQNGQYANGAMSPDGERFYFTICSDGQWNDRSTRCEIYVIKRNGSNWSQPERLPDYINAAGVTATQPFPVNIAGQEFLYFVSNREGGRGGLDIWFTSRDLGANTNDYTFPVNLGPSINTLGDEMTPYYNAEEGTLYFASNGQPTIGGFDIFKARGEETAWSQVENAGLPINSSADDYGYVMFPSKSGGFIVSNRVFGGEKSDTRNYDLLEFAIGGRRITLKGNVYDKISGELMSGVSVTVYQVFDDGSTNMLTAKDFPNGSYLFEILPNRQFRVEIKKPGYAPGGYSFRTDDPNSFTYGQPVFLELGNDMSANSEPTAGTGKKNNAPDPGTEEPDYSSEGGVVYTARGTAPKDNLEYNTTAPKHNGIYYKIQLAAVKQYKPGHAKFTRVENLGRIDTEELLNSGLVRVLLADFFSESEALDALGQVKSSGFSEAFVVKYEDGVRYGKVTLK